jgi:hypothetical protein
VQLEGDDVALELRAELTAFRPGVLSLTEQLRLGEHRIALTPHGGFATGRVTLRRVPRGRYAFTGATATVEDPFGSHAASRPSRKAARCRAPAPVDLAGVHRERTLGAGVTAAPAQAERLRLPACASTSRASRRAACLALDGQARRADGQGLEDAPRATTCDRARRRRCPCRPSFDAQVRAAYRCCGHSPPVDAPRCSRSTVQPSTTTSPPARLCGHDALAAAEPDGATPVAALLGGEIEPARTGRRAVVVTAAIPRALSDWLVGARPLPAAQPWSTSTPACPLGAACRRRICAPGGGVMVQSPGAAMTCPRPRRPPLRAAARA